MRDSGMSVDFFSGNWKTYHEISGREDGNSCWKPLALKVQIKVERN